MALNNNLYTHCLFSALQSPLQFDEISEFYISVGEDPKASSKPHPKKSFWIILVSSQMVEDS